MNDIIPPLSSSPIQSMGRQLNKPWCRSAAPLSPQSHRRSHSPSRWSVWIPQIPLRLQRDRSVFTYGDSGKRNKHPNTCSPLRTNSFSATPVTEEYHPLCMKSSINLKTSDNSWCCKACNISMAGLVKFSSRTSLWSSCGPWVPPLQNYRACPWSDLLGSLPFAVMAGSSTTSGEPFWLEPVGTSISAGPSGLPSGPADTSKSWSCRPGLKTHKKSWSHRNKILMVLNDNWVKTYGMTLTRLASASIRWMGGLVVLWCHRSNSKQSIGWTRVQILYSIVSLDVTPNPTLPSIVKVIC